MMRLRDRLAWLFFSRFQTETAQRTLKARYHQWQTYGCSRVVEVETILIALLFLLIHPLPRRLRERTKTIIYHVFGMTPSLYKTYKDRYLQFWGPGRIHTRLIVCLCPRLIPYSKRTQVLNQYRYWSKEAAQSPASALNEILDYIDSRKDNKYWNIRVRNIVEFTIWARGRVEKPFHLQAHGQWLLKDFPDPKCTDPIRYAIAASIMEQLVDIFNWRTKHGLRRDYIETGDELKCGINRDEDLPPAIIEEAPEWTKFVPPAPEGTVIESAYIGNDRSYDQVLAAHGELDPPNPHFLKRRLIVDANFLQFV